MVGWEGVPRLALVIGASEYDELPALPGARLDAPALRRLRAMALGCCCRR